LAGAFLAGAFFTMAFLAGAFFTMAFLAGAFLAPKLFFTDGVVAMVILLRSVQFTKHRTSAALYQPNRPSAFMRAALWTS